MFTDPIKQLLKDDIAGLLLHHFDAVNAVVKDVQLLNVLPQLVIADVFQLPVLIVTKLVQSRNVIFKLTIDEVSHPLTSKEVSPVHP